VTATWKSPRLGQTCFYLRTILPSRNFLLHCGSRVHTHWPSKLQKTPTNSCHFCAKAQGKALHISTFGLLSSFQLLCTLTHSPAMTNDGRMMAIVWEDHEVFKTLNSCWEDIKGVAIALGGKKKKAMEIETDDKD